MSPLLRFSQKCLTGYSKSTISILTFKLGPQREISNVKIGDPKEEVRKVELNVDVCTLFESGLILVSVSWVRLSIVRDPVCILIPTNYFYI